MATMSIFTVSGKVAHAASTAARCGSVAATAAAHAVSFTVSGLPADSQAFDLSMFAKTLQRFSNFVLRI